jgi:hypothetical protein
MKQSKAVPQPLQEYNQLGSGSFVRLLHNVCSSFVNIHDHTFLKISNMMAELSGNAFSQSAVPHTKLETLMSF